MKTVDFPRWPTWNYSFPEKDLKDVVSVKYWPPVALPAPDSQEVIEPPTQVLLDEELWRFATGRNGVCSLVFLDKPNLPVLAARVDAVTVEYEP